MGYNLQWVPNTCMKNLGFISKFLIEINDLKVTSLGYDLGSHSCILLEFCFKLDILDFNKKI